MSDVSLYKGSYVINVAYMTLNKVRIGFMLSYAALLHNTGYVTHYNISSSDKESGIVSEPQMVMPEPCCVIMHYNNTVCNAIRKRCCIITRHFEVTF